MFSQELLSGMKIFLESFCVIFLNGFVHIRNFIVAIKHSVDTYSIIMQSDPF